MILRAEHNSDYLVVSNAVLRDHRISATAKGVLLMMLSNSNDWNFNTKWIEQTANVSHNTALKILHELQEAGYIIVAPKRSRGTNGRFNGGEWIVRECPTVQNLNHGESTTVENLNCGDTTTVQNLNQDHGSKIEPLINTIDNKYHRVEIPLYSTVQNLNCGDKPPVEDEKSLTEVKEKDTTVQKMNHGKKKSKSEKEEVMKLLSDRAGDDEELMELFMEWLSNRKAKRAPETVCAIKRNLNKLDEYAQQSGMTVNGYMSEVVRRGWQGLFIIKDYTNARPQQKNNQDNGLSYLERILGGEEQNGID